MFIVRIVVTESVNDTGSDPDLTTLTVSTNIQVSTPDSESTNPLIAVALSVSDNGSNSELIKSELFSCEKSCICVIENNESTNTVEKILHLLSAFNNSIML